MLILLALAAIVVAVALVGIVGPISFGLINIIPLQIQDVPEDDTGNDNDIVIDQPNGIIYMKIAGTWEQIYPAIIL